MSELLDGLFFEADEKLKAISAKREACYAAYNKAKSPIKREILARLVEQEKQARKDRTKKLLAAGPGTKDPEGVGFEYKLVTCTADGRAHAELQGPDVVGMLLDIPPCNITMDRRSGEVYAGHVVLPVEMAAIKMRARAGLVFAEAAPEKGKGRSRNSGYANGETQTAAGSMVVPEGFVTGAFERAILLTAYENQFDPVVQYLDSLTWDEVDRFPGFLAALNCPEEKELYQRHLERHAIGSVARAYENGCKMDTMLVFFEPKGGAGKSRAFQTWYGKRFFSDTPLEMDSKDRFLPLRRCWASEWSELATMKRADKHEEGKAFLSSEQDLMRDPYGRGLSMNPRRCVFVGTTNQRAFMSEDRGGNRRFWVIPVGTIDVDWIASNRDQLWAQARAYYREGRAWWIEAGSPDFEELEADNSANVETDDRETTLAIWLAARAKDLGKDAEKDWVTLPEAAQALGFGTASLDTRAQRLVGGLLRKCGWERVQRRVHSKVQKVWAVAE